jgi:hypothetical protein
MILYKDSYLQDQLTKTLTKSYDNHKPFKKATGQTSVHISAIAEKVDDKAVVQTSYIGVAAQWKCSYRLEITGNNFSTAPQS